MNDSARGGRPAPTPCVLVFAGADPSGGAGIAADILAIHAQGAHALPVITAVTVQDNQRVYEVQPMDAGLVLRQARALTAQVAIAAIKIGIPGSAANARAIAQLITELRVRQPELPVVLDPVLASGHGDLLSRDDAIQALAPLLPLVTLLTPNGPEAAALSGLTPHGLARVHHGVRHQGVDTASAVGTDVHRGVRHRGVNTASAAGADVHRGVRHRGVNTASAVDADGHRGVRHHGVDTDSAVVAGGGAEADAEAAALARDQADALCARGCRYVLITGGHGSGSAVVNRCFGSGLEQSWSWPRLPGEFHGSGCTLAAAAAALLAQGHPMAPALALAQGYSHRALATAFAIAPGQRIPQR